MYSDEEHGGADGVADGEETSLRRSRLEEATAGSSQQGPSPLARAMEASAFAQGSKTPLVGVKKRLSLFVTS